MKKKRTWHLTVYLIKKEYTKFLDCLRENIEYKEYQIKKEFNIDGKIIIGVTTENEPKWRDFIVSGSASSKIPDLLNTSTRAAILIRYDNSIFVYTFGYGRFLIKDEAIIYNFGFKVAVNAINADKLKSIDIANLEELTVQSKIQASRSTKKESFGIDILNDLMRSVTGIPKDIAFAKILTGKDAVAFSSELDFNDLLEKTIKLKKYYQSQHYKKQFDWIDNLIEERDKQRINELILRLINDIKSNNIQKMHLTPAETIDWSNISEFQYFTGQYTRETFYDLDICDYLNSIKDITELDFDKLKKHKIGIRYSDSDVIIPNWKIIDCLTYETEFEKFKYVFTLGHWYKINIIFADEVISYINKIPQYKGILPDCPKKFNEEQYNKMVSKSNKDYILMDRKNIKCESTRTYIEVCDIFTINKSFIHIKQKHNSANLSHLFSQGRISAESFLKDKKFRQSFRNIIKQSEKFDHTIIPIETEPDAREYEIVFAIIEKSNKKVIDFLPFFSLLNLRQSVTMLRLLGFKVSLKKIQKK